MAPLVSVIVPVLGDRAPARALLAQIRPDPRVETIVVEAAEGPDPEPLATGRADVTVIQSSVGRGLQMNAGARLARGEWLLFVHADSHLSLDWLDTFEASTRGNAVGGWFRFALADSAWQARVIERGVAWRIRFLKLPYGDQGLFARRLTFVEVGGYREWPLMEDVEFIRRLAGAGPLIEVPAAIATSARRWRRDGWFRRSARNLTLLTLYFCGVPPRALARWY